ncbi:MAG: manganese efflux pump MntP family protein [Candidatus Korarchaeum sp.]
MDPANLLTSVSLATDCFSVSISNSACLKRFGTREALASATSFGSFQFLMLCVGWLLGASVISYIEDVDHWIAFALLLLVSIRMIKGGDPKMGSTVTLLALSVATSVDAFSVGTAISLVGVDMLAPALTAGISSFLLTLLGYRLGFRFGRTLGRNAERAGGLILVLIGIKVLIEHTVI